MKLNLKAIVTLSLAGLLSSQVGALALDPHRDATHFYYEPGNNTTATWDGVYRSTTVTFDACGLGVVKPVSKAMTLDYKVGATNTFLSKTYDIADNTLPTCNKTTGVLSSPRTAAFKVPGNPKVDFVLVGTPNTVVDVDRKIRITTKVTKNACGWAKLKMPAEFDGNEIGFNGNAYSTDNVFNEPLIPNAPICRKTGNTGTVYVKAPLN